MLILNRLIKLILIFLLYIIVATLMLNVAQADAPIGEVKIYPKGLPEQKHFAYDIVKETWGEYQWEFFDDLINRESGWRSDVKNPNSSAFGLCQTMLSLHDVDKDFKTNSTKQIIWCVEYVEERYETPKKAIIFWNKNGWF